MKKRNSAGYSVAELAVSSAVAMAVGVVIFTILNTATVLSATNVSINATHLSVRRSVDKVLAKVGVAAGAPDLVNADGAVVSGSGPAEGIRCFIPASPQAYPIPSAVNGTDMTLTALIDSRPAPRAGDVMIMTDLGFQGTVASSNSSGNSCTITLTTTAGNCFSPVRGGAVIPANAKFFLYTPTAFISVNNVLRYYPRAKSVAADGAAAFNNEANFMRIATLVPLSGATNSLPFQYLGTARRSVDLTLRINTSTYSNRVKVFNKFLSIRTTAAFRSASLLRAN